MFFRRWSSTAQLLAVVLIITFAPIVTTELAANGFERISVFLDRWQTLIAGCFAVLAAYVTVREMQMGRRQTEEFWIADRKRLIRLERKAAREVLFKQLEALLGGMHISQDALDRMDQPGAFDPILFGEANKKLLEAMRLAVSPDVQDALELLGIEGDTFFFKAQHASEASQRAREAFDHAYKKSSVPDVYGNTQNDVAHEAWVIWDSEMETLRASYNILRYEITELIGMANAS